MLFTHICSSSVHKILMPTCKWNHFKIVLTLLELYSQVDIEAFVDGWRWSWIKSGKFEKWVAANTMLHIYPDERVIEVEEDGIFLFTQDRGFWLGEEVD